jgi:hypothetical protein
VTTSQRIAISLLSVLLALAIAALCLGVLNSLHNPKLWLTATVGFFFYGLLFCSAGWLLALPLVVLIRRADGWHFWAALAVGSAIGPATMILFAAYLELKSNLPWSAIFSHRNPLSNTLTWLSAVISLLTTLFFLLFLRRAQREQPKDVIAAQIAPPDNFKRNI